MKNFFCWSLGILAGLVSPAQSDDQERLIICGRERVFVIPAKGNLKAVHWEWRSEDSKEIPKGMRGSFATTDECKPYEGMILITSSSGGVALVERIRKSTFSRRSVMLIAPVCCPAERWRLPRVLEATR